MNFDIRPLITALEIHQNKENAQPMKHYMRDQFPFFGIKAPDRRAIVRDFIRNYGLPESDQLPLIIKQLWNLPMRECQTAALDLLGYAKKQLKADHMPLLEWLIVTKSWWDTVDYIAPQCCGTLFKHDPYLIELYADKWIVSQNIWLRRAALLHQLKYKQMTNEARLFRYILLNADSDQFFIQKAIGWVLREYSKTDPHAVQLFIQQHELKPLSTREGLKWLNRHYLKSKGE